MTKSPKKRGVTKMDNRSTQPKPRIFELWDKIFGTETQADEAAKHGGKKTHDRE